MMRWTPLVCLVLSAFSSFVSATDCRAMLDPQGRLTDPDLVHYVRTGDLFEGLLLKIHLSPFAAAPARPTPVRALELSVHQAVLRDMETISRALLDLRGRPKQECPFEETVGVAGFTFERLDYLGRHVIDIRRTRDHFYWTIGVKYNGDFWRLGNEVEITGYYHVGTNGNVVDMLEALNATRALFPEVSAKR